MLNSTLRLSSSSHLYASASASTSTSSEVGLLEDSLRECDQSRQFFANENGQLRELIGDVEEWVEGMGQLRGISTRVDDIERNHEVSLLSLRFSSAIFIELNWIQASHIPQPYLSQPVSSLAPLIHSHLHHIRTSIVNTLETVDDRVQFARDSAEKYFEIERIDHHEEKARRIAIENELVEIKAMAVDSEALLQFTSAAFRAGVTNTET